MAFDMNLCYFEIITICYHTLEPTHKFNFILESNLKHSVGGKQREDEDNIETTPNLEDEISRRQTSLKKNEDV